MEGATNETFCLDPKPVVYKKNAWIKTPYGNKISKKSILCGSDKICVRGKTIIEPGAVIRGDLAVVNIGESCIVGENVVIRSFNGRFKGEFLFIPMVVGDHVVIEKNTIIEAANIGSYVHVGKNVVVSQRCILSSCCRILDNTVLAPGTVVAPLAIFGGNPGHKIGQVPPSFHVSMMELTNGFYKCFKSDKDINKIK